MPDEPATPRPPAPGGPEQPPRRLMVASWRVDGRLMGMRIAGTVIFLAAAVVLRRDPLGLALSALAAAGLLVYSVRDLLAPVRLAADREGITLVAGFARRVRLR